MDKLKNFLHQLLQHIGYLDDEINLKIEEEDNLVRVNITVPDSDSGMMIGKNGDVLTSIQRLTRLVFRDQIDKKIQVNINDYRQNREKKLKELTRKIAEEVRETKNPIMIKKPLSSYERYLIHQTINLEFPNLESLSQGEGDGRRVVIRLKENQQEQ